MTTSTINRRRFLTGAAVRDADQQRVAEAVRRHSAAAPYGDFCKMLDEMDRRIDALVVATP